MREHQIGLSKTVKRLLRRPLSFLTGMLAVLMVIVPLYQRMIGRIYLEGLNYVDGTTLIMVGILLLLGIISRHSDSDLQAFSIALIGALSFIFTFEALYKLSFYALPWRMPPGELREFVIQVGVALTGLAGFAFNKYRMTKSSWILTGFFIAGWTFWLLIGFPQLSNGEGFYPAVMDIDLTRDMIYTLNRALKLMLFLVFFSFYSNKPAMHIST